MAATGTPAPLLRALASAIGRGILLPFLGTSLWHAALLANAILSPAVPWFIVIAAASLYVATRYVCREEVTRNRLAFRSISGRALAFGIAASIACLSISILEGSLASLALGPLAAPVHASPFVANLAILLLPAYAAVIEELAFRGVVQTSLEGRIGRNPAIGIATLLFLGVHLPKGDFAAQWLFYLTFSLTLGIVAAKFRSLVS